MLTVYRENGSAYTDSAYAQTLELHRRRQEEGNALHKLYNVVVDAMGSKLLEISIPHYKKWTSSLRPDSLYPLSPSYVPSPPRIVESPADLQNILCSRRRE